MGRKRTGVSDKVTGDVVRRLVEVRALWLAVHNDPNLLLENPPPDRGPRGVSGEFYFAIGELLEGKSIEQIQLNQIDRVRALRHVREG